MTLRCFTANEVAQALPFPALIDHLSVALAAPAIVPLRLSLTTASNRELLVMPALSDRFAGVKVLTVVPENGGNGRPVISGLFLLLDARSGLPLATLDAGELTGRRTAAVSALASRRLSRENAERLVMIGTGHLVPYLAEAHALVRPVRHIDIWGRSVVKAEATKRAIERRLPGVTVEVVADLRDAVALGDIVSAATRAQKPLIEGAWIRAGTHLDLVGGYRPGMREIDDAGVSMATLFVDNLEGALAEADDLCSPIERGVISESDIRGDIAALIAGTGRANDQEITLFKSVGSALSDLAAAEMAWTSRFG